MKTYSYSWVARTSQPLVGRVMVVAIAMMACFSTTVHATPWNNNVEISLFSGNQRTLLGAQALIPLSQDADSLWYADIRGVLSDHNTDEINLGGGYRRFSENGKWILGGYAAYDSRHSASGVRWEQGTLGFEALSDTWDIRGNIYRPFNNKKQTGASTSTVTTNTSSTSSTSTNVYTDPDFSGHTVAYTSTTTTTTATTATTTTTTTAQAIYEEALSGYDIEIGRLLPFSDKHEIRGYLGAYHYDGDLVDDADGISARLEWRPRKNLTIALSSSNDNLFGNETRLEFRWSFGTSRKSGHRSLRERMTQFVQRDVDIRETSSLPIADRDIDMGVIDSDSESTVISSETETTGPTSEIETDIVHIDNTAASGGDGTVENPFSSFGECRAASGSGGQGCGDNNDTRYIYVHSGSGSYDTSDGDGDGSGGDSEFRLKHNVMLAGEGAEFFGAPAGTAPVLTASDGVDTIISLNRQSDNYIYPDINFGNIISGEIVGLAFTGSDLIGIDVFGGGTAYTQPDQNVTIRNNSFSNIGTAVRIDAITLHDPYNTSNQTIDITDNLMDGGDTGILIYGLSTGGFGSPRRPATLNQTVNITGINQIYNFSRGIDIYGLPGGQIAYDHFTGVETDPFASGALNQNITIDGAIIEENGRGINVNNVSFANTVRFFNATNGDYDYIGGEQVQNITVSNSTISNNNNAIILQNTGYGFFFHIRAGPDGIPVGVGTAHQNISLVDNTILNNTRNGVRVSNLALDPIYPSGNDIMAIRIGNGNQAVNLFHHPEYLQSAPSMIFIASGTYQPSYDYRTTPQPVYWPTATAIQSLEMQGNTIGNNGRYGVKLTNHSRQFGESRQQVTLGGNTIQGNGYGGLEINNLTEPDPPEATPGYYVMPGNSVQNVTGTTTNTITGNTDNDVVILNSLQYGTADQTVDLNNINFGSCASDNIINAGGDGTYTQTIIPGC